MEERPSEFVSRAQTAEGSRLPRTTLLITLAIFATLLLRCDSPQNDAISEYFDRIDVSQDFTQRGDRLAADFHKQREAASPEVRVILQGRYFGDLALLLEELASAFRSKRPPPEVEPEHFLFVTSLGDTIDALRRAGFELRDGASPDQARQIVLSVVLPAMLNLDLACGALTDAAHRLGYVFEGQCLSLRDDELAFAAAQFMSGRVTWE